MLKSKIQVSICIGTMQLPVNIHRTFNVFLFLRRYMVSCCFGLRPRKEKKVSETKLADKS